jgi:hypothetical protein
LVVAALLPVFLATGCATSTQTGALTGGVIGGVAGNLIGAATHNRAAGTVIGAAAGAGIGAIAGNSVDEAKERKAVQQAAAVQAEAQRRWPTIGEIQQMSAGGTSDTLIINQIRSTGAVYNLGYEHIKWLQDNGVHDGVIAEMQATATRVQPTPPPVVYQPVPVRERVVIVEEPPPPSFRFGYSRHW